MRPAIHSQTQTIRFMLVPAVGITFENKLPLATDEFVKLAAELGFVSNVNDVTQYAISY